MRLNQYPNFKALLLLLLVTACALTVRAQSQPSGVQNLVTKIDTFNNRLPAEKLYLQFDKPYYATGDTIWFKAYLVNPTLVYSPLSSRLYIELLNDSSKVMKRIAVPVALGISWGNIALDAIREGSYTIRAYTNWMRNFGTDYFFNQSFYIANPQRQTLLVNAASKLGGTGDAANNVKMDVRFTSLNAQPAGLREMQLRVMDGKRTIYKGTTQTTAEGTMDVSFALPEKTAVKNLSLVAQDKADARRTVVIPVRANRAKDIDAQFMPEGGYLVAGLPSHIGFKVIADDGRGIAVSGKIINAATGQEIVDIQTTHKGIGTFEIAPQPGDSYLARFTLADGQTRDVPLPAVKPSGTVIRVRNNANRDSLEVFFYQSEDLAKPGSFYYLVGQSRGVVCFGAAIPTGKTYTTVHIAKSLFPTGIVHLTVLNAANQPLNERLTYINQHDNLKINIDPGVKTYAPHDSIPVKIKVSDAAGQPVVGSFSVAVTDDTQVRADSSDAGNILSRFLLTSDLKGYVEDPSYYLSDDKGAWQALDGLLLTQGWVGYDWSSILNPPQPAFKPEFQYMVTGKVTNLLGKPIAKSEVTLLATGKRRFVRDTVTNAAGRFVFDNFPPLDTVTFVLSALNARHKVVNNGITIDETQPPAVDPKQIWHTIPWYVNSDPSVVNYVKVNPGYHKELEKAQYGPQGKMLNNVTIRGNAVVKGSANLNGAGEADQVIDEETLINADKMTLGELLEQKVPGFREGFMPKTQERIYFLKDKRVHLVFDGVDINRFYEPIEGGPPDQLYYYMKQYLDYFTAEDIKGIEVLYSSRYANAYNTRNLSTQDLLAENQAGGRGSSTASIEITTRSGNGPFTQRATGIYVYKPMLLTLPKEFYRPRYSVSHPGKYADLRSTIHWQPSIVTSKTGEATVSFYAADKPATYTVVLQGSDLNGKAGYQTAKITVK